MITNIVSWYKIHYFQYTVTTWAQELPENTSLSSKNILSFRHHNLQNGVFLETCKCWVGGILGGSGFLWMKCIMLRNNQINFRSNTNTAQFTNEADAWNRPEETTTFENVAINITVSNILYLCRDIPSLNQHMKCFFCRDLLLSASQ